MNKCEQCVVVVNPQNAQPLLNEKLSDGWLVKELRAFEVTTVKAQFGDAIKHPNAFQGDMLVILERDKQG